MDRNNFGGSFSVVDSSDTDDSPISRNSRYRPNIQNRQSLPTMHLDPQFQNFQQSASVQTPHFPFSQLSQQSMSPTDYMWAMSAQCGMPNGFPFPPHPVVYRPTPTNPTSGVPARGLDTISLESSHESPPEPTRRGKTVAMSWSHAEDVLLCTAYCTIGGDPAVGNAQKRDCFWGRIAQYYNTAGQQRNFIERTMESSKSHFYLFHGDCLKFNASINMFRDEHKSGENDADILQRALQEWNISMKKKSGFRWIHCWEILRNSPKFLSATNEMRGGKKGYYLTDGIYPEWAVFVKSFQCPSDEKRKKFKQRQEAARKDIERAFGVLQSRWAIIKGPTRGWYKEDLNEIMLSCIILHNMIIEEEGEDVVNWNDPVEQPFVQPFEGPPQDFQRYLQIRTELQDKEMHHQLRHDLIEHICNNPHFQE
ncbi:hypothetical protein OROHE_018189 [Orobanche hederae]